VNKPLIELASRRVHTWADAAAARVRDGLARRGDDDAERGDVPGWVLVTLMTDRGVTC